MKPPIGSRYFSFDLVYSLDQLKLVIIGIAKNSLCLSAALLELPSGLAFHCIQKLFVLQEPRPSANHWNLMRAIALFQKLQADNFSIFLAL